MLLYYEYWLDEGGPDNKGADTQPGQCLISPNSVFQLFKCCALVGPLIFY